MQKHFKVQLAQIAAAAKTEAIAQKSWNDDSVYLWGFGEELIELAGSIKGGTVFYEYVLPTFFTDDAVEYLLTLPNLYWFWTLVYDSARKTGHANGKITLLDIQHVVNATYRKELTDKHVRLDQSIQVVSSAEACFLLEKGVVQLKQVEGTIELIRNPMFELR